jgi:hypothetical protein
LANGVSHKQEEVHIYLPLGIQPKDPHSFDLRELTTLVRARNVFAFLVGQIVVGTTILPSFFDAFTDLALQLKNYDFTNGDGTSFGKVTDSNLLRYIDDLQLNDVRMNVRKMVEAIVLGERLKCMESPIGTSSHT